MFSTQFSVWNKQQQSPQTNNRFFCMRLKVLIVFNRLDVGKAGIESFNLFYYILQIEIVLILKGNEV